VRQKLDETLKARARQMRSEATPAEAKLWALLRAHRFADVKFTCQVIVAPYILDFAARSHRIAIEIDGDTHGRQTGYDAARTDFLNQQGYRVIRFTNADVMANLEGVTFAIEVALAAAPLPGPLPGGERE
jgi:very-short-patch-repair endonuclease